MAVGNIFNIPVKTTVSKTLQGTVLAVAGNAKAGKSTLCAHTKRPIFLQSEVGTQNLTGFVPVDIRSWADFKQAVSQLSSKQGRETFDTVVIDSGTALATMLDTYCAPRVPRKKDDPELTFASEAAFGAGTKIIKNEWDAQMNKLSGLGYLVVLIIHTKEDTDFDTKQTKITCQLAPALWTLIERSTDQIVYCSKKINPKTKEYEYLTWFNSRGGFASTDGRSKPKVDYVESKWELVEQALLDGIEEVAGDAEVVVSESAKAIVAEEGKTFAELQAEFKEVSGAFVAKGQPEIVTEVIASVLGPDRKVSQLNPTQTEQLDEIVTLLKEKLN